MRFRKKYVEECLKNKKGECKMHGCCGRTSFLRIGQYNVKFHCIHFDNNRCGIWDNKPLRCVKSPFDEKDKSDFQKNNCGFYWGERE